MTSVACYLLSTVCRRVNAILVCPLSAVCSLLFGVWCLLSASAVCCLLSAVCCLRLLSAVVRAQIVRSAAVTSPQSPLPPPPPPRRTTPAPYRLAAGAVRRLNRDTPLIPAGNLGRKDCRTAPQRATPCLRGPHSPHGTTSGRRWARGEHLTCSTVQGVRAASGRRADSASRGDLWCRHGTGR